MRLADAALGPRCPICDHRARGWRSLLDHFDTSPYACRAIAEQRAARSPQHRQETRTVTAQATSQAPAPTTARTAGREGAR